MKKNILATLVALMALTAATTLTSCSDSDNDSTLVVNSGETTVSINRLGGSIEIPIKTDGQWIAEVERVDGELPFAACVAETGSGNATLEVEVDYFNPKAQKQERTARLVVRSGDRTQTVNIRQYIGLRDGETAPNDTETPFYDLWFNKGIGCGINPETGDQLSPVLNVKTLQKAQRDGKEEYATLFRQTTYMNAANDVKMIDTLDNNTVGLKVDASIEVEYLKFKLKIAVKYDNTGLQLNNVKTYNGAQKVVFLESYTDVMTARSLMLADPHFAKGTTKNMASIGFRSLYSDIYDASEAGDEQELQACIDDLLDGYGPVFINGAELGGSLFVSMRYDSLTMANNLDVTGKLEAKLALAAISIGAKADATYSRTGQDIWRNSQHYSTCVGGDQAAITQLAGLIGDLEPDPAKVREVGQAWAHSIVCSDNEDDNTSLVKITYSPIWNLFPRKIATKIKARVAERYKGKRLGIADPTLMDVLAD